MSVMIPLSRVSADSVGERSGFGGVPLPTLLYLCRHPHTCALRPISTILLTCRPSTRSTVPTVSRLTLWIIRHDGRELPWDISFEVWESMRKADNLSANEQESNSTMG